ncbi:MAG: hypothetical protein ACJA2O_001994 [Candidatus Azotimanducaceae bacterium]
MFYLVGLILLVFSQNILAADISKSGYVKSYINVQAGLNNPLLNTQTLYQSQNSARLMLDVFTENKVWQIHFEGGLDLQSSQLPEQKVNNSFSPNSYRFKDLQTRSGGSKNAFAQNLDRFNVQLQLHSGDLTIGRQAITLGSARIINPTDVFLPFNVRARNTEYRTGIDAIRFQKPLGELSELDLGIIVGEDAKPESSAIFVQYLSHFSKSDIQLTAIQFSKQKLIGLGIQSALGLIGTWFEIAYVAGDDNYSRLSTGIDYAPTENTLLMIEYHYNGAGAGSPLQYQRLQNDSAYQSGGVFFSNKDYVMPSLSWQVSALLSISLQGIFNLRDESYFLNTGISYSISENFYMGLSYYHFSGKDIQLSDTVLAFGSEYGSSPNSVSINFSYYF